MKFRPVPRRIAWILTVTSFVMVILFTSTGSGRADASPSKDAAGEYTLRQQVQPAPPSVVPDSDFVTVTTRVLHRGQPADDVTIHYRLYSPPAASWLSTDYPRVENTTLVSGSTNPDDGSHVLRLILPIRGTYRMRIRAAGPKGTTERTFHIPIAENPREMVNALLLLGVLVGVGLAGGVLLGKRVGIGVGCTLPLLVLLLSQNTAPLRAAEKQPFEPGWLNQNTGVSGQTGTYRFDSSVFPLPARAGRLLDVHLEVHNRKRETAPGKAPPLYRAELQFVRGNSGRPTIEDTVTLNRGQINLRYQLYDASPHFLVTRLFRPRSMPGGGRRPSFDPAKTEDEWDWAGQYHLEKGEYMVRFSGGDIPFVKWVMLPDTVASPTETVNGGMKSDCRAVESGGFLSSDPGCYHLVLESRPVSFMLGVFRSRRYFLFLQHSPETVGMEFSSHGEPPVQP